VKEQIIFNILLMAWLVLAAVVAVALLFIVAPYGRHVRKGWGYAVGNKLGWVLMEAPAPVIFAIYFFIAGKTGVTGIVLLALWEAHYLHRAFIYPFGRRGTARRMPLSVVGFGFFFNLMNGYFNGRYIYTFSGGYSVNWLADPRFILGAILFVTGFVINRQADYVLRGLRRPGESDYKLPDSWLYRRVSSPNYLGEIIIWMGWALATWSLPGLVFACWTIANLLPRARANHAWYKANFPDYPPGRKALLPGLW
jgi:3-oxo-5-alpha-steroid 4-dehydrogenase 1